MDYTPSKERAKIIKKTLSENKTLKENGILFKRLSVVKGKGTASSWVELWGDIQKPQSCTCTPEEMCQDCRVLINRAHDLINKEVNITFASLGIEHSTYCSDDGYNTKRDEFLVQLNTIS
jgi:hypothetical protein